MARNATAVPGRGKASPNNIWTMRSKGGKDSPAYNQSKAAPAGLVFNAMDNYDGTNRDVNGTSIFDPVLCELAYRWFCPMGGLVLDPFAGGSVRGIVAAQLGRHYLGIDLSERQLAANRAQAQAICKGVVPQWLCGDSRQIATLLPPGTEADFVFSCPPYADLEIYSDDPADLSTMPYPEFTAAMGQIIAACYAALKPDRFACFCVGEARGRDGAYYGFVPDTIKAFMAAGFRFYNEAILLTMVGSLPVRAGKQFVAARKLGKTHQNVLVFVKGDARKATAAVGECEFGFTDSDAPDGESGALAGQA